jgi:hypothetical protein
VQRAHQVLPVLQDPLVFEALRVTSADKVPQVIWVRRGRGIQGQRGRQVLLPPLQVQQVMQGPLGRLDPQVPLVLTDFLSQVLQASRDWQVLLVWPGLHQTRAPQALVAHEAGRVLEVTWARLEHLL